MNTYIDSNDLKRLYCHISPQRRRQLFALLVLTVLASIAEVVSLGSIFPFIGVLTDPGRVFSSPRFSNFLNIIGVTSADDIAKPFIVIFAAAAIISGAFRLILLKYRLNLSNGIGSDLSKAIYQKTLYQPYEVHISRNSSEIISGVTQKVGSATSIVSAVLTFLTGCTLFASILVTLIAIDPVVAFGAVTIFGFSYLTIAKFAKRRLSINSQLISREHTKVIKSLQEGLGAIRDVIIDGSQKVYVDLYQKSVLSLDRACGENHFINQAPRYLMESIGLLLIALFVTLLGGQPGGILAALPILGALALGAQRILPLMQQLYASWVEIRSNKAQLGDVLSLLDQVELKATIDQQSFMANFNRSIEFRNVDYQYQGGNSRVIQNISVDISKGARIGLIGTTGSGKSTFLDLLMGLITPSVGVIYIDDLPLREFNISAWQKKIAHVPQSIFLTDASIAENIAFGESPESASFERIKLAAERAQIASFIENCPAGYKEVVGERGVRLSGGQRQRIGIARALYKEASLLVLDEATSALDSNTEKDLMNTINTLGNDLTVIMVAHRMSTLDKCDQIIQLEKGAIVKIGKYDDFI